MIVLNMGRLNDDNKIGGLKFGDAIYILVTILPTVKFISTSIFPVLQ